MISIKTLIKLDYKSLKPITWYIDGRFKTKMEGMLIFSIATFLQKKRNVSNHIQKMYYLNPNDKIQATNQYDGTCTLKITIWIWNVH
jgi:hypothetical protein